MSEEIRPEEDRHPGRRRRATMTRRPPRVVAVAMMMTTSTTASATGRCTGGLIPYKNPAAFIAYYLGVFGLIPCAGMLLGPAATSSGCLGLALQAQPSDQRWDGPRHRRHRPRVARRPGPHLVGHLRSSCWPRGDGAGRGGSPTRAGARRTTVPSAGSIRRSLHGRCCHRTPRHRPARRRPGHRRRGRAPHARRRAGHRVPLLPGPGQGHRDAPTRSSRRSSCKTSSCRTSTGCCW